MGKRFFSAVMAAMMLSIASVGAVTASAEDAADSAVEAVEQAVPDNIDSSEEGYESEDTSQPTTAKNNSSENGSSAASSSFSDEDMEKFREVMNELEEAGTTDVAPDYDGDPYYDTDGNATLIKSEQIIYNTEEMQFIAVTTKDGHVFYVLINYTAENGQDNVYFLNKVDDYDLYALLYAGEEDEDGNAKYTPEEAAKAAESANGRVKNDGNTSDNTYASEASTEGDESGEDVPVRKAPANMGSIYLVVGVLALIGVGAGGFFLMKKKKGGNGTRQAELDPDDYKSDEDDELDMFDGNDSYDDE